MRSPSLAAVTSPRSSMTPTAPSADRARVLNWVVDTAAPSSGRTSARCGHVPQRTRLVVVDVDELGQPGDGEDLPVVVGQAVGAELAAVPAGASQQPHEQRDAGGVDVVDAGQVEDDGLRATRGGVG